MESNENEAFVNEQSIVRKIWGKGDTILFIFAGAAAEFALNKAVDWLYYTGRLPADPLGRLFSTVAYARTIVFANKQTAYHSIDAITAIHKSVEVNRGATIPDWAYRDVLFMLIDYSIRSFELLERKLTTAEKQEVFQVFHRVGQRMQLTGLPTAYTTWRQMRKHHLQTDLKYSAYTSHLFAQYKKHLGAMRYRLLLETQKEITPKHVRKLLGLNTSWLLPTLLKLYKLSRKLNAESLIRNSLLPKEYKAQIKALDSPTFQQNR